MNSFQKTPLSADISNYDAPISRHTLAYIQQRTKNNLYSLIMSKFNERVAHGLTKSKLASRLGIDRGQITRMLSAPGNWTIETVAALLLAISNEELDTKSHKIGSGDANNYHADHWIGDDTLHNQQITGVSSQVSVRAKFHIVHHGNEAA